MRRLIWIVLGLVVCASSQAQFRLPDYSSLNDSEVVSSMKSQIGFLSSAMLEGRKAGSEGEREAAAFVADELQKCGVELMHGSEGDIFGMKRENGDTLTSRNVIGFIPGYDRDLKEHYIVIGARLDNMGSMTVKVDGEPREKIFYGANGNASGLSMMLQLARMLSTNRVLLKRSVIFAAFGSSLELGGGSWYFLNRSFGGVSGIDAMINLDMLGTGSSGFYAYAASNRDLEKLLDEVSGTVQPIVPRKVALEPVNSDHRSFYNKEIPAVFFTTGMYPEYNSEKDTESIIEYEPMERELEYIYNFSLALVNGDKPSFRKEDDTRRRRVFDRDVYPYYDCDQPPIFLGSTDPKEFLRKWVYMYLRYPRAAVEKGIQGRVLVDFVIDAKGKVTDVKVVKGVDPLLDEEALRVIKSSPDWKPARMNGEKVKCEMSLYVEFKLEKRK